MGFDYLVVNLTPFTNHSVLYPVPNPFVDPLYYIHDEIIQFLNHVISMHDVEHDCKCFTEDIFIQQQEVQLFQGGSKNLIQYLGSNFLSHQVLLN